MIKLTLRNGDKTENVEFPCSEKRLAEVEELLHLDSIPLIEEVLYPKQLSSIMFFTSFCFLFDFQISKTLS